MGIHRLECCVSGAELTGAIEVREEMARSGLSRLPKQCTIVHSGKDELSENALRIKKFMIKKDISQVRKISEKSERIVKKTSKPSEVFNSSSLTFDEFERGEATSSLKRLLQILDLFTLECPTVRLEQVVNEFGIVQSTAYRYLRELCDAGLLASQGKGEYSLGRRIVELERLLQLSDPLLLGGKPVTDELQPYCTNHAFLLCTYYKDGVLCVYKIGPDEISFRGTLMKIQRGRGTTLPLFRGAGSQVILAYLPPHQIKSLYLTHASEIASAGLGKTWKEFRSSLAEIRKSGYTETIGRMNPGMHSIAVPITRNGTKVIGSLLLLSAATKAGMAEAVSLLPLLHEKAEKIANALPKSQAE